MHSPGPYEKQRSCHTVEIGKLMYFNDFLNPARRKLLTLNVITSGA